MKQQFERELRYIKFEYEKALDLVKHMGGNLKDMFKEKSMKIKENCSKFFSKIDMQVGINTKDVYELGKKFSEWQETSQGPAQKYDAAIYSLRSQYQMAEQERETEFTVLKKSVHKLVTALCDKVEDTSDMSFPAGVVYHNTPTQALSPQASQMLTPKNNMDSSAAIEIHQNAQASSTGHKFNNRKSSMPPPSHTHVSLALPQINSPVGTSTPANQSFNLNGLNAKPQ